MADYVYSPLYPVVRRSLLATSHRSGWALYWAEALGAQLVTSEDDLGLLDRVRTGDRVFLYHGMEFQSFMDGRPLNVYHGHEESLARRFQLLHGLARWLKGNLVSLDRVMPPYGRLIADRAAYPSFEPYRHAWRDVDPKAIDRALTKGSSLLRAPFNGTLVLGDSHALSLMHPGARVERHDGLTLHGALAQGLELLVGCAWNEKMDGKLKHLIVYLGNIDVRHHLGRPNATPSSELVAELSRQLRRVQRLYRCKVTVTQPLLIETEERSIPRTGWYKGTPFYGSWAERSRLRNQFSDELRALCQKTHFSYLEHPSYFRDSIGQLDELVMERPGSVHIRPAEYLHRRLGHDWTCFQPKGTTR